MWLVGNLGGGMNLGLKCYVCKGKAFWRSFALIGDGFAGTDARFDHAQAVVAFSLELMVRHAVLLRKRRREIAGLPLQGHIELLT